MQLVIHGHVGFELGGAVVGPSVGFGPFIIFNHNAAEAAGQLHRTGLVGNLQIAAVTSGILYVAIGFDNHSVIGVGTKVVGAVFGNRSRWL